MNIAIIGTRDPSPEQIQNVKDVIDSLDDNDIVISGCAVGIDCIALKYAKEKGLITVGNVPFDGYNLHIQSYCSKVYVYDQSCLDATSSVFKHHPNPKALSQVAFNLMARNFMIIELANKVYAYPKKDRFGGFGGTGQGIKIANDLNIECIIMEK